MGALPVKQHRDWASELTTRRPAGPTFEGTTLDVAAWFRSMIDLLALPTYSTLAEVNGAQKFLAAPIEHLRANRRHWTTATLTLLPSASVAEPTINAPRGEELEATSRGASRVPIGSEMQTTATIQSDQSALSIPEVRTIAPGDATIRQDPSILVENDVATLPPGATLLGATLAPGDDVATLPPGATLAP